MFKIKMDGLVPHLSEGYFVKKFMPKAALACNQIHNIKICKHEHLLKVFIVKQDSMWSM